MSEKKEITPPSATAHPQRGRRILLTEVNIPRRGAMRQALTEAGYLVTECAGAADVLKHAKATLPDMIVLDTCLPGDQARQCIRLLKRCYQTSCVAIVLTCPRAFDPQTLCELTREGAALILPRPYSRARLLDMASAASKRSDIMNAELASALGRSGPSARRVKSNNSLMARPVGCQFHDDRPQFDRYFLRNGAVSASTNFLDVPTYGSNMPGFDRVNFHLLSILVCPECLFASSHSGYFIDLAEHKEPHCECGETTRISIALDAEARREMARSRRASSNFFNERRTVPDAMLAYELAMRCSDILYSNNKHSMPGELLRQGNYHLRLAQLFESRGPAAAASVRKHLLDAIPPLKRAEAVLDGAARYKAAFQLAALAITLGDDHGANFFLNHLADLEAAAIGEDKLHAVPYLQRARQAWESRENNRLRQQLEPAA
ncbi:MAG: DUF2225 domain-containing protein [Planctomycetota bacterium]|nr:DUF2225 domain-containing protein [Planctomycetota bacterium]